MAANLNPISIKPKTCAKFFNLIVIDQGESSQPFWTFFFLHTAVVSLPFWAPNIY